MSILQRLHDWKFDMFILKYSATTFKAIIKEKTLYSRIILLSDFISDSMPLFIWRISETRVDARMEKHHLENWKRNKIASGPRARKAMRMGSSERTREFGNSS